jgi:ubiquinone biosynthesis protein
MKEKFQQSVSSMKTYELLLESKEFIEKLPSRVNTFLDKLSSNELELKVKSIDEAYLMNGFQKIANRITAGIIFGAMILGASLLFRMETSFVILGYPGFAVMLFIIGITGGLYIAFSALFKDEPDIRKKE